MLCRGIWTLSCLEFSKVCPFHSTACMACLSKICPVSTCWHYFEFYLGRDLLRKNCYSRFLKIFKYFEENWRKELRFYDWYWKSYKAGKAWKRAIMESIPMMHIVPEPKCNKYFVDVSIFRKPQRSNKLSVSLGTLV